MRNNSKKKVVCSAKGNLRSASSLRRWLNGFTLIELLTVMAIIVVLASLVLMGTRFSQDKSYRSKAESEIKSMCVACESYKADQGVYPLPCPIQVSGTTLLTRNPSTLESYKPASRALYQALSGDGNDALPNGNIASSGTVTDGQTQYMPFPPKMLGGLDPATLKVTGSTYIQDPFGNSYGYYAPNLSGTTAQSGTAVAFNPTYDLWSTAGAYSSLSGTNDYSKWIKNW